MEVGSGLSSLSALSSPAPPVRPAPCVPCVQLHHFLLYCGSILSCVFQVLQVAISGEHESLGFS